MTKNEFLSELRTALKGNIPNQDIEENIRFYESYFRDSDKTERQVCQELGDPRLIARTIIDSFTAAKGPMASYYTEQARNEYSEEKRRESAGETDSFEEAEGLSGKMKYILRKGVQLALIILVAIVLVCLVRVTLSVVIPIILIIIIINFLLDLFRRY